MSLSWKRKWLLCPLLFQQPVNQCCHCWCVSSVQLTTDQILPDGWHQWALHSTPLPIGSTSGSTWRPLTTALWTTRSCWSTQQVKSRINGHKRRKLSSVKGWVNMCFGFLVKFTFHRHSPVIIRLSSIDSLPLWCSVLSCDGTGKTTWTCCHIANSWK